MTRLVYFDCFSGISGAMALAALVHAGADIDHLSEVVRELPSAGFDIEAEEVETLGIAALRVHVRSRAEGVIRTYASIRATLDEAMLPEPVRLAAQRAFRLLAEADARVHGREVELVTFHDTADIDPIVAIVGTALALDELQVERIFASPVPTGLGMARTDHGMVPIPSPVVVTLLQGAPTYSRGIPVDLVTPVGAALLAALAEGYGDMPMMRADAIGYGAGALRLDFPHILRVVVGVEERAGLGPERAPEAGDSLLQAHFDLDPDRVGPVLEELQSAGARDVWAIPLAGPQAQRGAIIHAVVGRESLGTVVSALRRRGEARIYLTDLQSPPVT